MEGLRHSDAWTLAGKTATPNLQAKTVIVERTSTASPVGCEVFESVKESRADGSEHAESNGQKAQFILEQLYAVQTRHTGTVALFPPPAPRNYLECPRCHSATAFVTYERVETYCSFCLVLT